ncbi:protein aurora borealis [Hylaeus anthracinus]|uniref:protein aurora borealis n=1 Tax=Hylaeus anthracinus TaxID=313031 RepID=UPI0023B8D687|nr:protein aurora borealis [Hylaeus anthracinus]XP_054001202.1 protein aurora borealis [Hylaeus anthracinus]
MDQLKWTTPIKNENNCDSLSIKSPVLYKTPVKHCETNLRHAQYQSNMSYFTVLPNHITPPSGLTKFIARNPFETDLTNRLHLSVISPTVFSKTSTPSQQSPDFAWSVDELALIQPAKIEEFPMQQIHCMDPETEIKAQAAIDQFFKENQIIPSPWEMKRKDSRIKAKEDTPKRASNSLHLESSKTKKDGWSQTVLSLPPELPPHVAEALKPYFTFTQEQNAEGDDANSSNNSLRRKLFFNNDDCMGNEEEASVYLSPIQMSGSLLCSSPPQSGMLVDGLPMKHLETTYDKHATSQITAGNLSSPSISPIHGTPHNVSGENIRSKLRPVTRLDFTTEMSIDEHQSILFHKEYFNDHSLDEPLDKVNIPTTEKKMDDFVCFDTNSTCIQVSSIAEPKIVSNSSTHSERYPKTEASEFNVKQLNTSNAFKQSTDSCKIYTNESCILQQTNATLGISDHYSVSNCVQDTGYQTYSMSSTTNINDSYNTTPVKQKASWDQNLTQDEFRLSDWKENMKNIFSSTPSKTNREWDNYIH